MASLQYQIHKVLQSKYKLAIYFIINLLICLSLYSPTIVSCTNDIHTSEITSLLAENKKLSSQLTVLSDENKTLKAKINLLEVQKIAFNVANKRYMEIEQLQNMEHQTTIAHLNTNLTYLFKELITVREELSVTKSLLEKVKGENFDLSIDLLSHKRLYPEVTTRAQSSQTFFEENSDTSVIEESPAIKKRKK